MSDWDCTKCGACCQVYDVPVEPHRRSIVNGALHAKLLPTLPAQLGRYERPCMPKNAEGGCVAYEGTIGAGGCGIYGHYPQVCHDYLVGGTNCTVTRILAGIDTTPDPATFIHRLLNGQTARYVAHWRDFYSRRGDAKRAGWCAGLYWRLLELSEAPPRGMFHHDEDLRRRKTDAQRLLERQREDAIARDEPYERKHFTVETSAVLAQMAELRTTFDEY